MADASRGKIAIAAFKFVHGGQPLAHEITKSSTRRKYYKGGSDSYFQKLKYPIIYNMASHL